MRLTFDPTWANVCECIRDGSDELYAIGADLGCDLEALMLALAEMTDKELLARWDGNGVTRYRIPADKQWAA